MRMSAISIATAIAWPLAGVAAAEECSALSVTTAKSEIRAALRAANFPRREVSFVMAGADGDLARLRWQDLNTQGQTCGIDPVRAHVLRCTAQRLPWLLKQTPKPPASAASVSAWGKTRLSVREAIFLGKFHGCLTAAKDALFR
jgi:hypothetical protein